MTALNMLLLADDDQTILFATRLFLQNSGWDVITASDGQAACDAIDKHGAQLKGIITDITMPERSGIDVVVHLHQQYPKVPAILVTGMPDHPGLADQLKKSHVQLLEKPFPLRKLEQLIKALIEKPPLEDHTPPPAHPTGLTSG